VFDALASVLVIVFSFIVHVGAVNSSSTKTMDKQLGKERERGREREMRVKFRVVFTGRCRFSSCVAA